MPRREVPNDPGPPTREMFVGQPKPILVPVDFSEFSEAALVWGVEAARCYGAPLLVLHVIHDPAAAPGYYRKEGTDAMVSMEERAREMLDEFLVQARNKHPQLVSLGPIRTKLTSGLPGSRILEVAGKVDARMIVMGSKGRTGLRHLMMGSKAERVVRMSEIPVTVVKGPGTGKKKKKKDKKKDKS